MFIRDRGIIALVLAAIAMWCTWMSVADHARAQTVAQDGVPVWAALENRKVVGTETGVRYVLVYRVTMNGVPELHEVDVSQAEYHDVNGWVAQIRLPTADPDLIARRTAELRRSAQQMQTWALIAGLSALATGAFAGRRATQALMARRWGREEDAYVTKRAVFHHSKSPPTAQLVFRSHSGAEGKSFNRYEMNMPQLGRGDIIRVFVRNGRAWWVDDTGPRLDKPEKLPRVTRTRRPKPRIRHES